jgi:anti-sigma regulatory factor (Ser/Thr protein kinase)
MKSQSPPTPAAGENEDPRTVRLQLSSTPRGARLARLLTERQLDAWGLPRTAPVAVAVLAVTAELAANAITHGRTPGRDFEVRLTWVRAGSRVRVEVGDTRTDRLPPEPEKAHAPGATDIGGRGLLIVDALAERWGCTMRDAHVKVVWAEVAAHT